MIELYKTFYKLKRDPFRLSPDHRCPTYAHPTYKKSLAYLKFAAYREEGFVMITGRPGTGKTTLINEVVSITDPGKVLYATLVSTQLDATDLLAVLAASFNINTTSEVKSTLLLLIEKFLKFRFEEGKRVILIVDEAQGLKREAIEELRMLSNMNVDSKPLLQIFLIGQDELKNLVRSPDMEQLRQRLIATSFIEPLTENEVSAYVRHRLNVAGWSGDPSIEKAAIRLVHHYSMGVPRKINLICGRLLLNGCMEEKHELTRIDLEGVVSELKSELLLLDEDAMSYEDIVTTGDELEGFLEPPAQPQKKADIEETPEDTGSPVETSKSDRGAPEIKPQPASNVKPASSREPPVQPQKKPAIKEVSEDSGSPVKSGRFARNTPDNIEVSAAVDIANHPGPTAYIDPQPADDINPAHRKLRAQLLLLGVLLFAALALFVFKVMSGYISDAIELEAYTVTEEIATRVTSIEEHYGESVAQLAKDPGIVAAFMSEDSNALRAKEESLRYAFPKAINVQLLPSGIEEVDDESSPPLGYAALEQMRAAENSTELLPMEVHLYNTPQQHIVFVHRITDPANSNVIGHIRLALSNEILLNIVQDLHRVNGYIEIQQINPKVNPVAIVKYGDQDALFDDAELVSLPLNGNTWQVVYWPAASSLGYLSGGSFWALGALLLSTLTIMSLIVIVLHQRW